MWKYNNTSELYHWGIKGMKWGIRRYQNDDGSLTPAGKRRYSVDLETFGRKSKKKLSRSSGESNGGGESPKETRKDEHQSTKAPGKMQKNQKGEYDALKNTKNAVDTTANVTNNVNSVVQKIPTKPRPRMDLNNMTDKELRDKINREQLERQYNDLFSQPTTAEIGKQRTQEILSSIGSVLTVASTALGIALLVRDLKSGKSNK